MTRAIALIAMTLGVLSLKAADGAPVPPVQTLYADAVAQEKAVRTALAPAQPPATVLKAVRTVVQQYEAVFRFYPNSGYGDDALWLAGRLSLDAFGKFGDTHDQEAGVRLLRALAREYPTSKLAKQVPAALAGVDSLPIPGPKTELASVDGTPMPQRPGGNNVIPDANNVMPAAVKSAAGADLDRPVATIKDIRRTSLPDVVRITIELDGEVPFHAERLSDPPRVFVDLTSARAVPTLRDQTLRFDSDTDLVRQIRLGRHPNDTTRVVLETAGISSYSVYPLYSPYRLVIDCVRELPAVLADASKPAAMPRHAMLATTPLVRRLLPTDLFASFPSAPREGASLLAAATALDAAPAIATTTVTPLPAVPLTPPTPPPAPPARNLAGGFSIARQLGLSVSRIAMNPGHGGHDPGAKGNGMTEAELVLDVALRLEELLVKVPGVEVVLTRRDDEYVPLQQRTAIANREDADLFLSIHANGSTNTQAQGVESYFLNWTGNAGAQALAARENASSGQAMAHLPDLLNAIALTNKLDESRDLATMVQRAMIDKLKVANKTVKDLGVKQAPFVVLIGAAMPSVLTEISFVTNAQEAKLLKGSAYRQRIAEALFNAIRKYQTSLKNLPTVAARP